MQRRCDSHETIEPIGGSRLSRHAKLLIAAFLFARILLPAKPGPLVAQDKPRLTVAVAADLQPLMKELQPRWEQETGSELAIVAGASGNLCTQIENGAPYDVFLSADMGYPRKLIEKRLAERDSLYRYAVGRLILWAAEGSKIDLAKLGINAVVAPEVTRIAIANPQHAPYGQAAVSALKHFKLYQRVAPKLVLGESVSQAAQFVESGNAQIGFVPLSQVYGKEPEPRGSYFEVPIDSYPALEQGAVILTRAKAAGLAQKFLEFLKHPPAQMLLKKYGFVTPPSLGQ